MPRPAAHALEVLLEARHCAARGAEHETDPFARQGARKSCVCQRVVRCDHSELHHPIHPAQIERGDRLARIEVFDQGCALRSSAVGPETADGSDARAARLQGGDDAFDSTPEG